MALRTPQHHATAFQRSPAAVAMVLVSVSCAAPAVQQSPTQSAVSESSGPIATPAPTAPQSITATGSASASPLQGLTSDSIVVTLVDDLVVRDAPSTSGIPIGVLGPAGEALFVVDGPRVADGHEWYQVALVGEMDGTCAAAAEPSARCRVLFGWAAGTGANAEAWLALQPDGCLPPTHDTSTYVSRTPLEQLACFGDVTWTLRGYFAPPTGVNCGIGPAHDDPPWLAPCAFVLLQAQENEYESGFAVHVDPALGACPFRGLDPGCPFADLIGEWIEVSGHLDDPAAASCVPPIGEGRGPEFIRPDPDWVILDCRATFVATSVTASDPP